MRKFLGTSFDYSYQSVLLAGHILLIAQLLFLQKGSASEGGREAVELTPQVAFTTPKVISFGGVHPKDGSKKKTKKRPQ